MAVALVNLLAEGEQRGRTYLPPAGAQRSAQLNALFEAARSRTVVTEAEAGAFGGVAADLRGVFAALATGDIDDAARRVNGMLKATGAHPSLERHDGGEHYDRLGVCTAPHCDRVYVDTSRNGSKRFCSTACQNRVKTAAFREARREPAAVQ